MKMKTSKITITHLVILSMLLISTATPILACKHCKRSSPTHKHKKQPPPTTVPPPPESPSPAAATCPVDTLKLGACVDLLGGLIHIGLGGPVVNECCPLINGLLEIEAAVCLCTTLKLKALNLNIYVPIALQLLLTCGKPPPPGYTCSIN